MSQIHLLEIKLWLINIGLIAISLVTAEAILRIMILLGSLIYTILKIKDQLKQNQIDKNKKSETTQTDEEEN